MKLSPIFQLLLSTSIFQLISCQSNVYEFQQKASNHSRLKHELVGHSIETFDNHILVTQCALACLKSSKCLSYNHDRASKTCNLNQATHLSNPSSLKASTTTNYYLRDAFAIDVVSQLTFKKELTLTYTLETVKA